MKENMPIYDTDFGRRLEAAGALRFTTEVQHLKGETTKYSALKLEAPDDYNNLEVHMDANGGICYFQCGVGNYVPKEAFLSQEGFTKFLVSAKELME